MRVSKKSIEQKSDQDDSLAGGNMKHEIVFWLFTIVLTGCQIEEAMAARYVAIHPDVPMIQEVRVFDNGLELKGIKVSPTARFAGNLPDAIFCNQHLKPRIPSMARIWILDHCAGASNGTSDAVVAASANFLDTGECLMIGHSSEAPPAPKFRTSQYVTCK